MTETDEPCEQLDIKSLAPFPRIRWPNSGNLPAAAPAGNRSRTGAPAAQARESNAGAVKIVTDDSAH
jgi:hypothetical protein